MTQEKRGEGGKERKGEGGKEERRKGGGRNRSRRSRVRAGQEGRDGLDSGDKKQEAQKEDSPDIRQGGWSKTSAMEMEMSDKVDDIVKKIPISDQDVYVTSGGRILRRSDKLESCEVRDGSTIQVMSRMRGGGKHKDKKSKVDKKQPVSAKTPEQKSTDEEEGDRGPAILENEKEAIIPMWEENEVSRKLMDVTPEGSDVEMEQALQSYRTACREVLGWDQGQADMMECGLRWTAEARRSDGGKESKDSTQERNKARKASKWILQAKSPDEPEVMGRLAEVRTCRGSSGLVRGGDERCRADETRKGKGKGNGGKGEHEGKGGGVGRKGTQQVENLVMDEFQENHREDVRKLVEMMQKEEEDQEGQRGGA